MSQFTEDDEAFIQSFTSLSTADSDCPSVKIPSAAISSIDWSLCLLACVVTDRSILDEPFAKMMLRAWGADSTTTWRSVAKNCYLFEFNQLKDLHSAQLGGPWSYRGDLVALRQVTSQQELSSEHIDKVTMTVLILNIPVNAFTDDGLEMIGRAVGIPVSLPVHGFIHGRRFVKLKVMVPIGEAVKDRVKVEHPTLGELTLFCSYEEGFAHLPLLW